MFSLKRILFILIVALFSCLQVNARHLYFRNVNKKDGLPGNKVYRVYQDKRGYIWYLTDNGIARYDGLEWNYFSENPEGYEHLKAFHMAESPDGMIWFITTDFKLLRYDGKHFHESCIGEKITWIEYSQGMLLCMNRLGQVFVRHKRWEPFHRPKKSGTHIFYSFLMINKNKILLCNNDGIMFKSHNSMQQFLLKANTYKNHVIPRAFRMLNGKIILTQSQGIYEFNPGTERVERIYPFKHNEVVSMQEDPETKDIWMGTSHGLYHFQQGMLSQKALTIYLPDKVISSIQKTNNGMIHFTTMDNGVFRCNTKCMHYDESNGLKYPQISFVRFLKDKMLLIGQNHGMYGLKKNGFYILPNTAAFSKATNNIYNVHKIEDSLLLIISDRQSIWNGQTLNSYALGICKESYLLFSQIDGVYNLSLIDYFKQKESFRNYVSRMIPFLEGIQNKKKNVEISLCLRIEKNRIIFLGKGADNSYIIDVSKDKNGKPICKIIAAPGFVSDARITAEGNIIMSTLNKGVAILCHDSIKIIDTHQGLLSNYCAKILRHGQDYWVLTDNGISKISLNKQNNLDKISNFHSDNYLNSDEINDFTIHHDSVYVATNAGISIFSVNITADTNYTPVYIERVLINNLDTSLSQNYQLPYNLNNISVSYKSPKDGVGQKCMYKYYVSGYTADTIYTSSTTLQLGYLFPGQYQISIWSLNQNGKWSKMPATLSFTIHHPFWKEIWFISTMIGVAGLISWLSIFYYFKSRQKKAETEMKMIENELRSLRLYMNPHFIFNSLTSLQSFILTNKNDDAEEFISNFSTLIRSIMSYSLQGEITLEKEVILLKQYIDLELKRFEKLFDYEINIDPHIPSTGIIIPSLIIQPFVENAIKHGLSGLNRKGKLTIDFSMANMNLQCIIQDNGRGFTQNKGENFNDQGNPHISSGISFTKERIRLLSSNKIKKAISIIPCFENQKPMGVKVIIIIPVLKNLSHD